MILAVLVLMAPAMARAADNAANSLEMQSGKVEPYVSPTHGLGYWIWEEQTSNDQTCRFWRTFEIPPGAGVAKARLAMTADNEFTLYLDGQKLGRGAEWRELFVFDVTRLLGPGRHILAAECYNGSFYAGMLLGLNVELEDGRRIEVKSDSSWRVAREPGRGWENRAEAPPGWPAASIKAPLGGSPWWTEPMAVIVMPSLHPPQVRFWQTGWFQIALFSVSGLVLLVSIGVMMQLALHRKERRLLYGERVRIARDIHDDIGARMTQLVVQGEVAQNGLPADSDMRQQMAWICEEVRGVLATMDEILWTVSPQHDTLPDFADYVSNYAQEFLKPTAIHCAFAVAPELPPAALNFAVRRSLLMAIKEALNNAVKHSGASELCFQLEVRNSRLLVAVQDNGQGFDTAAVRPGRNGLSNMARRLSELGGTCAITSRPGQGCRVEFGIPLERSLWRQSWGVRSNSALDARAGRAQSNLLSSEHDPAQPPK
jgi:hypothetical protein